MVKQINRQQKAANTRKAKAALKNIKEPWEQIAIKELQLQSKTYAPAPALTLCGQLEDAIMLLEVRISNATAKINSLM